MQQALQSGFKVAHSTETALWAITKKEHAGRSAKLSTGHPLDVQTAQSLVVFKQRRRPLPEIIKLALSLK